MLLFLSLVIKAGDFSRQPCCPCRPEFLWLSDLAFGGPDRSKRILDGSRFWPPRAPSTSPRIVPAIGSRVGRLRFIVADFIVSGFPCFSSPFPASPQLLLGFSGSSSESGQMNIFAPPASASTRFSFPHPLSSSPSSPMGDGRATVARAGGRPHPPPPPDTSISVHD